MRFHARVACRDGGVRQCQAASVRRLSATARAGSARRGSWRKQGIGTPPQMTATVAAVISSYGARTAPVSPRPACHSPQRQEVPGPGLVSYYSTSSRETSAASLWRPTPAAAVEEMQEAAG